MLSVQYALANTKPAPGSDGLSGTVGSSLAILGARKRRIQASAAEEDSSNSVQVSPDSRGARVRIGKKRGKCSGYDTDALMSCSRDQVEYSHRVAPDAPFQQL